MKKLIKIIGKCKIKKCRKTFSIIVDKDEYNTYINSKLPIQKAMPTTSTTNREIIITGMCKDCLGISFKNLINIMNEIKND